MGPEEALNIVRRIKRPVRAIRKDAVNCARNVRVTPNSYWRSLGFFFYAGEVNGHFLRSRDQWGNVEISFWKYEKLSRCTDCNLPGYRSVTKRVLRRPRRTDAFVAQMWDETYGWELRCNQCFRLKARGFLIDTAPQVAAERQRAHEEHLFWQEQYDLLEALWALKLVLRTKSDRRAQKAAELLSARI